MKNRQRFHETMGYGAPDRVPYFEEGIREEVLEVWRTQGLPANADISKMFPADRQIEIALDLDPRPELQKWPSTVCDLAVFRKHLDADDPGRRPDNWAELVRTSARDESVVMLRVHRGFFLTMGVRAWKRFHELMSLLIEDPELVRQAMEIQGRFAARLVERTLSEIKVDAAVFSEPIGGNGGPLIAPRMYEDFVLKSYEPVLAALRRGGVEIIIFRTYANARLLIPSILKWGFNCLWACEVNLEAMDYADLRREFGRDLRLIGGIDLDALRRGPAAIRREIERTVPQLIADGGYVPLADGRIREDVPFENYRYYRRLLENVIQG
ncbi:MAG: hypothetical protein JSW39_03140 [Desulfobacterales bacterium]|nr:MAG: hypothetical protein JSW39_03140 [Desulfobacterales bacterium]